MFLDKICNSTYKHAQIAEYDVTRNINISLHLYYVKRNHRHLTIFQKYLIKLLDILDNIDYNDNIKITKEAIL